MNQVIYNTIESQKRQQNALPYQFKKDNGIFFTNEIKIVDSVLDIIKFDSGIINKKILDPAVGNGIFLLRIIEKTYQCCPSKKEIKNFIENGLFFIDVDSKKIEETKKNICNLYRYLFNEQYAGKFNDFVYDFTEKIETDLVLFKEKKFQALENLSHKIDYVVGNPPYVTLYGRRDRKKSELQRIKYLNQYKQFPQNLKNGKINYVMLFIEHSLEYLKKNGKLSFIIDISFFETAYKYTRKYLLENVRIISIENNISHFSGVASGQLILKIQNRSTRNNMVRVKDFCSNEIQKINQRSWLNEKDEYKFRLNFSDNIQFLLRKINSKAPQNLKEQFPKKSLRTCAMLLNMEDRFIKVREEKQKNCNVYKYYQGSKSLYDKYCVPYYDKYFYYNKILQDKINDELKITLATQGIKNKKRIGLGNFLVYDNPKIFIRQSAKEIIATYDETPSASNNSLYVFSLRKGDKEAKEYLKFLCGYLNSSVITFYSQTREIIRYRKGKQPQIKTSDLCLIPVPKDIYLIKEISHLVNAVYKNKYKKKYIVKIDEIINNFFGFSKNEIEQINRFISTYLKS